MTTEQTVATKPGIFAHPNEESRQSTLFGAGPVEAGVEPLEFHSPPLPQTLPLLPYGFFGALAVQCVFRARRTSPDYTAMILGIYLVRAMQTCSAVGQSNRYLELYNKLTTGGEGDMLLYIHGQDPAVPQLSETFGFMLHMGKSDMGVAKYYPLGNLDRLASTIATPACRYTEPWDERKDSLMPLESFDFLEVIQKYGARTVPYWYTSAVGKVSELQKGKKEGPLAFGAESGITPAALSPELEREIASAKPQVFGADAVPELPALSPVQRHFNRSPLFANQLEGTRPESVMVALQSITCDCYAKTYPWRGLYQGIYRGDVSRWFPDAIKTIDQLIQFPRTARYFFYEHFLYSPALPEELRGTLGILVEDPEIGSPTKKRVVFIPVIELKAGGHPEWVTEPRHLVITTDNSIHSWWNQLGRGGAR